MRLKIGFIVGVATLALVGGTVLPAQAAQARPAASCGAATPVAGTTTVAVGHTSAQVSITIWQCNNGAGYYTSANSTRDSNGFCFTGEVGIVTPINGPDAKSPAGCGVHDSGVVARVLNAPVGYFITTNGFFHVYQGKVQKFDFCQFGTDDTTVGPADGSHCKV